MVGRVGGEFVKEKEKSAGGFWLREKNWEEVKKGGKCKEPGPVERTLGEERKKMKRPIKKTSKNSQKKRKKSGGEKKRRRWD